MGKQALKGIYFSPEKLSDDDRIQIRNALKLAERRKQKAQLAKNARSRKEKG